MTDQEQQTHWVLRAQAGDSAAFDQLLRSIQEDVHRYLLHLVGDEVTADDVLQEVFLLIYRKLRWLREPLLFRPWLFRVATRQAFKHLKREQRWRGRGDDDDLLSSIPSPESNAAGRFDPELLSAVRRLVSQVSPASRVVLVQHYLHEMSLDEVADVLGVSLGTVKSRLAYGLANLRRMMKVPSHFDLKGGQDE